MGLEWGWGLGLEGQGQELGLGGHGQELGQQGRLEERDQHHLLRPAKRTVRVRTKTYWVMKYGLEMLTQLSDSVQHAKMYVGAS